MTDRRQDCDLWGFGAFELDLARGELRREGLVVPLRPKAFAVLRYMVERPGRLVTKDELLQVGWGRQIVTEASIVKCLKEIRRALDDDAHAIVRTVHGRGYRFDADVRAGATTHASPGTRPPAPWDAPAGAPGREPPAAVGGAGTGRRAAARAAAPLALLMLAIPWLVSFDAASTGTPSSPAADCARADAAAAEPACRDYREGAFYFQRRSPGDLERAESSYLRALRANPAHARSWVGLSAVSLVRRQGAPDAAALDRERTTLLHAVEIEPTLAEAHARLGANYSERGDCARARSELQLALRLGPDDPVTLSLAAGAAMSRGRLEQAVALQRHAANADPLSAVQHANLAYYLAAVGRPAEAERELEAASAIRGGVAFDASASVRLLVQQQRYGEALAAVAAFAPGPERDGLLVLMADHVPDRAAADAAFARLEAVAPIEALLVLAEARAQQGAVDAAIAALTQANARRHASRSSMPEWEWNGRLNTSPFLDALRRDDRWAALAGACSGGPPAGRAPDRA